MWWQGIDPVESIKILGRKNAIHYFHAKDTIIEQPNKNRNGLTDMTPNCNRSWYFRTVEIGHEEKYGPVFISLPFLNKIPSLSRISGFFPVIQCNIHDFCVFRVNRRNFSGYFRDILLFLLNKRSFSGYSMLYPRFSRFSRQ